MTDETKKDSYAVINSLREQINQIDTQILEMLASRRELSREVVAVKECGNLELRDSIREQELFTKQIDAGRNLGLDGYYVTKVFREIIADSIRLQQDYLLSKGAAVGKSLTRIAFQGSEGTHSHLVAQDFFARRVERLYFTGCDTYEEVAKAVQQGRVDFGVLPIENTASGGINEVYDLLLRAQVALVGEEKQKLEYALIGYPGAEIQNIRTILCQPQAAQRCARFIAEHPDWQVEFLGEAGAGLKRIQADKNLNQATIASPVAAESFGLTVLANELADQLDSHTRYIVLARNPLEVDTRIPCKTSIVMATAQEPGSLVKALLIFQQHGINLTKLESRPIVENPWEEMFYVDFEGNQAQEHVKATLDELARHCRFIKVLGSYPTEDIPFSEYKPGLVTEEETASGSECPPPVTKAPQSKGYRLVSRSYKADDTVIEVKGVRIGGSNFVVIAGPCSVESREQILSCAHEVKEHGAGILRGGCFKPRSSPYSFQGLGYQGLEMLCEAGRRYGLPVVTEVLAPEDVEQVALSADILQIGARNMQNFTLLSAVGRTRRPVMLKRGLSSSLEELLQAAEYILAQGNQQVFLCERGIRTFESATRNTLDLSAVPVLREQTHLPVIVDPSHAAGRRELVPPLAIAARAVGAHGVMIEIHPEPEKALSDGRQSLLYDQFAHLMTRLRS